MSKLNKYEKTRERLYQMIDGCYRPCRIEVNRGKSKAEIIMSFEKNGLIVDFAFSIPYSSEIGFNEISSTFGAYMCSPAKYSKTIIELLHRVC